MRAKITFDMAFDVNLDNDEILAAIREHDDAEGDATHAAVIEARERVHAIIAKMMPTFDTHEVNVREALVENVCAACEKLGVDYTTHAGVDMCAACVERVLTYRVVMDVLNTIGEYDIPLARAIGALDADDDAMNATNMPHVDSLSNAWDTLRGDSHADVIERIGALAHIVVNATREPGSVIAR